VDSKFNLWGDCVAAAEGGSEIISRSFFLLNALTSITSENYFANTPFH
jgi:hypothetical protein